MGTFLGVPIIRIIVFWGLYWGSLILGNHHLVTGPLEHAGQGHHAAAHADGNVLRRTPVLTPK